MRLPVCNALSGEVYQVDLADGALVEELRSCLKRQSGVEIDSQVLICEWEPERSLDKRKAVAYYGLPKEGYMIFLYDKAWFRAGGSAEANLPASQVPRIEVQLPTQEQSLAGSSFMGPQSTDVEPMQTALINYAANFAHWKRTAEAYHSAATTRIGISDRITDQLHMQKRGSVLARSSLQFYHKVVQESLGSLEKEWDRAHTEVDRILANFEHTIHKLRDTDLHAAHCAASRLPDGTKLMSFVKDEDALRKRVADCKQIHIKLEEQVKEGKRLFDEMSLKVTEELERSAGEERLVKDADEALAEMRTASLAVEEKRKTFASDFEELEKYLAAAHSEPKSSVSWEYMDSLQRKYQTGKDNVGVLSDADKDLHERLGQCVNRKDSMTRVVVARLQRVADLQGQLQQMKRKWDALQEVAGREMKRQFGEVEVILNLPETYRGWCDEVAKRNGYWKATVSQAEAASEVLQKFLDDEHERRLAYMQRWEQSLPEQLLRLLCDGGAGAARPPRIEINVSGRPRMLPAIAPTEEAQVNLVDILREGGGAVAGKGGGGSAAAPKAEADEALKKELGQLHEREGEWRKREEEMRKRIDRLEADVQAAEKEREARAQNAAKSADQQSQYEEDLNALEKELERKNKFLAEASENSARLELNLNFTREQLQMEKAQSERLLKGVGRIGETLGIEMKSLTGPSLLSGRPRRVSSNDRDAPDDGLEAVLGVVQKLAAAQSNGPPKISLSSFEENDVALFMPLGKDRVDPSGQRLYMAFNVDCPRHYLEPSSLAAFMEIDQAKAESYCLGKILHKQQHVADEDNCESYGISEGDAFWVCTAVPVAPG